MKSVAIIISPNYKDYAQRYLHECINSIRKQDYQGRMQIFLTDNETSQDSFRLLKEIAPEAQLVLNKKNDGFAKGNNDSIKEALLQGFDYIVLFNMDTVVSIGCVSELVSVAEKDVNIGAVQARLMLYEEKDKINSLGNITHFLGFGYCIGYNKPHFAKASRGRRITNIHYPSGAAVLFKKEVLGQVGLFDENYWMYNEDQELGWRIWLAGFKCVLASNAVVYHKYEFAKSIKQYYFMDRNRILSILLCYKLVTLILILPAFLFMELGLIIFSIKSGWFKEKMRVWGYFFSIKHWRWIIKARKRNQSMRVVNDKEIAKLITGRIWYQEIDDWKLKLVNPIFNVYWVIIRKVIKFIKL